MKPSKTYGTVATPREESHNQHQHSSSNDEENALLGNGQLPTSKNNWNSKLKENIHRERADVVLLFCYLITGLLDSASISTWGSFVSMQTGNTVYIGLGLAAPSESNRWIKSGSSLVSFCLGSFLFSRFHRLTNPSRRWALCVSFLFQTVLILISASILTWGPTSSPEETKTSISWNVLVPIALVAFQSSGQAVASRALKYNALTSVVLTSNYCDLFSDQDLFKLHNVERNRRVAAPVLLVVGAILGGLLAKGELGTAGVLWISAGLKLVVVVTWVFWRAEDE